MKKFKIILILLMFLVFGFGTLALTGCDDVDWADIYVVNDSDADITVVIVHSVYESSVDDYRPKTVLNKTLKTGEVANYFIEGLYSNQHEFKFTVTYKGTTWHWPDRHGEYYVIIKGECLLVFDGDNLEVRER